MTEDGAKAETGMTGGQRRSGRLVLRSVIGLVVLGLTALAVGFIQFADEVNATTGAKPPGQADGIVAFTGGRDRINGAITLLAEGYAKRLLISGVHPDTTEMALAELTGGHDDLFDCCIDLGHSALDTIGNADETAEWVKRLGFSSLIVVTSSYHMPRSLAELGRALPDVHLEGHAVPTPTVDIAHWWRTPQAAGLLMSEYVKLLAARARLGLSEAGPADRHAGSL